jgi:hypothetical protein
MLSSMEVTLECKKYFSHNFFSFDDENDDDLKALLARVEFFTIDYELTNSIPDETPATANCFDWTIS